MRQFRVPSKQKSRPSTNTSSQTALCASLRPPKTKVPSFHKHPQPNRAMRQFGVPSKHPSRLIPSLHHTPTNIHIAQPIPLCYTKTSQNHQNNLKEELEMDERLEDLRSAKNPKARIKILKGQLCNKSFPHQHLHRHVNGQIPSQQRP